MKKENLSFIQQRLHFLTEEFNSVEAEISIKLQRLKSLSTEMASLSLALHNDATPPTGEDSLMVNGVQTSPLSTGPYTRNGVKIRRGSIKDYIVQVLFDSERGMVALDILAAINKRFGTDYDRTSLSPQLSRLRQDGVLGLRGPVWYLISETKTSEWTDLI